MGGGMRGRFEPKVSTFLKKLGSSVLNLRRGPKLDTRTSRFLWPLVFHVSARPCPIPSVGRAILRAHDG